MEIWSDSDLIAYPDALARMEARAQAISEGEAPNTLWFLEHPPLYTAGTSAAEEDLTGLYPFPVYPAGRGGQYTYHGPGQRVVYAMIDLKIRGRDVRRFVTDLEQVIINTLGHFGVTGERRAGRIGVWVACDGTEKKIAALGIRVRRWVSFHGIAINVNPDLSHFGGIVPCGIRDFGVTSLHDLGVKADMADVDAALLQSFRTVFAPSKHREKGAA